MNAHKERFKLIVLGVLVVLAVIQTSMLWLGSMSSHTFLKQGAKYKPILPINIWLVETSNNDTGVPNALAYHLDDTTGNEKREYERLTNELSKVISQYSKGNGINKIEGVRWESILSVPSVIYEYEFPIDIAAVTGESQNDLIKVKIDHVIMYSKNKFQKDASVVLINSEEDVMYEFNVTGSFEDIGKIYKALTSDDLKKHVMAYQPSATIDKVPLEGNSFLPTSSKETLIEYQVLTSHNPINLEDEKGYGLLESYINGLFVSPLVKDKQVRTDGTVVYTEDMKTLVAYKPQGVIEYLNLSPKQTQSTITMLEGYNIALKFMDKTQSIPKSVAPNLYLADVQKKGQGYVYSFNMTYEGYRVQLTDHMKQYLGVESLVQIEVKGKDVIEATFCTLEIVPKNIGFRPLNTHYLEPMDKMYALLQETGNEDFMIEHLELVYLLTDINEEIDMTWGVLYDDRWYYP